jgi:hypothetical protein
MDAFNKAAPLWLKAGMQITALVEAVNVVGKISQISSNSNSSAIVRGPPT